jgi:photosystem II stability/assembly factor-like uncharacterized protein
MRQIKLRFLLLVALTLLGLTHKADAQSPWQQLGADTYRVAFCGDIPFVVTTHGRILRKTDDRWHYAASCPSSAYAVSFRENSGIVLGSRYSMITRDRGNTWETRQDSFVHNLSISWPEDNVVYNHTSLEEIIRSTDRGASWNVVAQLPRIRALGFVSASTGYVAGDSGRLYRTIDAGKSWSTIETPFSFEITTIKCMGDTIVVVGQGSEFYYSENGGKSWTFSKVDPAVDLAYPYDVAKSTSDKWFAVGSGSESRFMIHSERLSSEWSLPQLPKRLFTTPCVSIDFSDQHGLASGSEGSMYESTDAGEHWRLSALSAIQVPLNTNSIIGIGAGSQGRVYAVGDRSVLCTSSDGGLTWSTVQVSTYGQTFMKVHEYSDSVVIASGLDSALQRSTDGGWTWKKIDGMRPLGYHSLIQKGKTLWMSGSKYLLTSLDSGLSWQVIDSVTLPIFDMTTLPDGRFVAVGRKAGGGQAEFSISDQNGKNWTSTIFDTINGLSGITYMSGDSLMACGRNGLLMLSTDLGATWSPRSAGMSTIMSKILYHSDTLMVVASDIGVLESNDRGVTWHKITVPNLIRAFDGSSDFDYITSLSMTPDRKLIYAAGGDFVFVRGLEPDSVSTSRVDYGNISNIYLRIKPYPNPSVSGKARASIWGLSNSHNAKRSLALYDLRGTKVLDLSEQITQDPYAVAIDVEFDTRGLAKGTYMLVLDAGDDRLSEQMVIY